MSVTITNQLAASALRGQNVVVSCNATDAAKIASLTVGQSCTISGNSGRVAETFFGGTTFLVAPLNQGARFDSTSTPGELAASEVLTFN